MARKRYVSSEMSTDEDIADIAAENPVAALMWPWFITAFDDWGRMEVTSSTKIKLELFPAFPYGSTDIAKAIELYAKYGLVYKYSINNKDYIAIEPCKYYRYQTYIRDKKRVEDNSNHPAPDNAPWKDCAHCRALARICTPSPSPSPSPSIPEEEEKFANVIQFYQNNIGLIRDFTQQEIGSFIDDGVDTELIILIMQKSLTKSDSWAYAKKVLNNLLNENVKTVEQYEAKRVEFEKAKEKKQQSKAGSKYKPVNTGNFEQRNYDNDFLEGLYDNVRKDSS